MENQCEICGKLAAYKCPRCFIHYCSVSCCQKHKGDACEDKNVEITSQSNEKIRENKWEAESRSGIPKDKLQLLEKDEKLNNLLTNRHLRDLLMTVDKAENAEKIMHEAMQEPIFVEFADACLRIVDPVTEGNK